MLFKVFSACRTACAFAVLTLVFASPGLAQGDDDELNDWENVFNAAMYSDEYVEGDCEHNRYADEDMDPREVFILTREKALFHAWLKFDILNTLAASVGERLVPMSVRRVEATISGNGVTEPITIYVKYRITYMIVPADFSGPFPEPEYSAVLTVND